MFSLAKVSAAVLALASFAQATIVINGIPSIKGNSTTTITWSSTNLDSDPNSVTIELVNVVFHNQFAVGNNVPTSTGTLTFELPAVIPGDNYSFAFVANNNASDVLSMSNSFSIIENDVVNSTSSGASSASSATLPPSGLSTPLGTITQTGLSSAAITPAVGSATSSSSASAGAASATTFSSSGAMDHLPSTSFAALVAGVIALLF